MVKLLLLSKALLQKQKKKSFGGLVAVDQNKLRKAEIQNFSDNLLNLFKITNKDMTSKEAEIQNLKKIIKDGEALFEKG